uniref:Uncharacterized protein LOC111102232 n=1 Tax=Crassostrea virginica TaxID=6565 RepID=A0A8B8AGG6_CRAVI|nr:uncharacterized protein LOC111102232 [Crassostrea virginica]
MDSVTTTSSEQVKETGSQYSRGQKLVHQSPRRSLLLPVTASAVLSARGFASHAEVWVSESQPRQTFIMDDGTTHENYHDDYENGPGRWLQRHMRENHIQSAVFVITRRIQEGHIVPQQFSIMENLINEFANSLDA